MQGVGPPILAVVAIGALPGDLANTSDGTPLSEIAACYGVTVAVASRWVTIAGLPPRTHGPA